MTKLNLILPFTCISVLAATIPACSDSTDDETDERSAEAGLTDDGDHSDDHRRSPDDGGSDNQDTNDSVTHDAMTTDRQGDRLRPDDAGTSDLHVDAGEPSPLTRDTVDGGSPSDTASPGERDANVAGPTTEPAEGGPQGAADNGAYPHDAGEEPTDENCEFSYRSGHGDLYVEYSSKGGPSLRVRSELEPGAGELLYDPQRVCIEVPGSTFDATVEFGGRPETEAWDFLGIAEGEPFWFLPQVAQDEVPWFGVAAASAPSGLVGTNGLVLALVELSAPQGAAFAVWASDPFGNPKPILSSAAGLTETRVSPGSHAHFNWGFSTAGRYDITFGVHAEQAGGTKLREAESVFRFQVLP